MSKPEGAIELPIPADLANASLDDARDRLYSISSARIQFLTLKVPSQTAKTALLLTVGRDVYVELECEFDPDEWSLKAYSFDDGEQVRFREYEIWSPGA